ncbi:hypothetical protein H632_c1063p0, partial [Helicosporidium sp. ATCC 50920]
MRRAEAPARVGPVAVLAFLYASLAVRASPSTPAWSSDTFPNPKLSPERCGRSVAGNVCDPDSVLDRASQDRLEGLIKDIAAGVDPYALHDCAGKQQGYTIGVAVAARMSTSSGESLPESARAFAQAVHDAWGVGDRACNDGLLVFLALEQRQVYVSTGAAAAKALPDSAVTATVAASLPLLRAGDTGGALSQLLVDLGLGLAGAPPPEPRDSWLGRILDFSGLGFLAVVAGALFRNAFKAHRRTRDLAACRAQLDAIRQEQAALRTREWSMPKTCPICLEGLREEGKRDDEEGDGEGGDGERGSGSRRESSSRGEDGGERNPRDQRRSPPGEDAQALLSSSSDKRKPMTL